MLELFEHLIHGLDYIFSKHKQFYNFILYIPTPREPLKGRTRAFRKSYVEFSVKLNFSKVGGPNRTFKDFETEFWVDLIIFGSR